MTGPLRRPPAIRLGLARAALETRMFFREKDAVVFTLSLPIVLLVIFGSTLSGPMGPGGVDASQLYVALGSSLLGVAASTLPRSGRSAGAVIAMP